MSASAPMFESLGFFDFERPPSPSTTSKQPRNDQADDDFDMEAELAMMQEEETERRRRRLFDDPPPPMEEEEPDWEEDEAAMADAWADDAAGSTSVITQTVTRTTTATTLNITSAAMEGTESGQMTFGDSDIFDAPVASCKWSATCDVELTASFTAPIRHFPREHTHTCSCSAMQSPSSVG